MMQSCIVSMQVATCAVIIVYRQNKQGVKSSRQGNGGVIKTWHQGVKGVNMVKAQGEKS